MKSIKFDDWDKRKDLLEKIDLFRDFSRFEIPKVASLYSHIVFFDKNERIIRQSATDNCFYILLNGSVRVCKDDDPKAIATLDSGEFFGEISFLSNRLRTRHIFTNEKSFALRVTSDMLEHLEIELREKIKDKLIDKLVKRIMNPGRVEPEDLL